jgi:hypothetical protein
MDIEKDSTVTQEFTARISETNPYHVLVTSILKLGRNISLPFQRKRFLHTMIK